MMLTGNFRFTLSRAFPGSEIQRPDWKALEDIIKDDAKSEERTEAIKSLDRFHQYNLRNGSAEPDIRGRLERLDPSSVSQPQLKAHIDAAKRSVKKRINRQ